MHFTALWTVTLTYYLAQIIASPFLWDAQGVFAAVDIINEQRQKLCNKPQATPETTAASISGCLPSPHRAVARILQANTPVAQQIKGYHRSFGELVIERYPETEC